MDFLDLRNRESPMRIKGQEKETISIPAPSAMLLWLAFLQEANSFTNMMNAHSIL